MDVNALNYCRFSLMPSDSGTEKKAFVALPGLIDSSVVSTHLQLRLQAILRSYIG